MPTGVRLVLIIVTAVVLLFVGAIAAGTAALYQGGTIAVQVSGTHGGSEINIAVPAGLANLALALVPIVSIDVFEDDDVREWCNELQVWVPTAQAAIDALAAQPDFTLVEVNDGDERVTIRKEGRKLVIEVDSDDERIRVSVPLTTVREFCKKLGRISRRSDRF